MNNKNNHNNQIPVITLDGPSGTGKGTLCHLLAAHLNWHILDSGAIYRVLALASKELTIDVGDIDALEDLARHLELSFDEHNVYLSHKNVNDAIRTEQCGQYASKLAAIPGVRAALLMRQRAFAKQPGLVADGRDMGTIVFPDAVLKIYLFARPEIRAERRYIQLKKNGKSDTLAQVLDELEQRDVRDMSRQHAPLVAAKDAVIVDTSTLSIEEVFEEVLKWVVIRGLCSGKK